MDKVFSEPPVEEKEHRFKHFFSSRKLVIALIALALLNLVYLDVVFLQNTNVRTIEKIIQAPLSQPLIKNDDNFCSQSCISKINQLAGSLNKPTFTPSPTPTVAPTRAQASSPTTVKEYYIPFGSGSGSSLAWQDVSGLQAYVDSAAYGTIKSVIFEASVHVPTGNENVSVRLYNATDNHPVWYSQLDFSGSTASIPLSSNKITLDSGNKLYKVQIQTQLQYPAVIDQSRIHITAQ